MCHNTKCCNPEHLQTGTHKDNYHDSEEVHKAAGERKRKVWTVNGVTYSTSREVVKKTGLSMNSVIKYTFEGVFNELAYIKGCKKANVTPKILPK